MSYDKNQSQSALPTDENYKRTSSDFLPKYFRTDTNKKFLQSSIDQMISSGTLEKLNSYAGRRYARATKIDDTFYPDVSKEREQYQFENSTVVKDTLDNVTFYGDYIDYLGALKYNGIDTKNHNILNKQQSYALDSHIDWDKFTNFREYYWLPLGPKRITVIGQSKSVQSTYKITTSDQDNNTTYVFTPNGFTNNPTITLYKEQTYRFEINTPGHPFAFTYNRNVEDLNPTEVIEQNNLSRIYTKGITKYVYNEEGKLVLTDKDYIENGVIEWTVPVDVPEDLYYISSTDINTSGIVLNKGIEENSEIDVEKEILGKKTYTTSTGITLSNGMKVRFAGNVTPATYSEGEWFIEGVGDSIRIINQQDLEVPAVFTDEIEVPFDAYNFDDVPFEYADSYPADQDYIVINRGSADRNPWSRYNRWFHRDVIIASALENNADPELDEEARGKRPIIEFSAGLKLWKHGNVTKKNINLVDTFTNDVFSTIEGSVGYSIDNTEITNGMRVMFTADPDPFVNGKIYTVNFILHNGRTQISLVPTDDSDPIAGETVLVTNGNSYKGKMFFYDGEKWNLSQDKLTVNQPPLFDLFDKGGNNLNDTLYYPTSTFKGNKVFSYAVGSGSNDSILGFPIKYRNINNIGDIVFDYNLLSETISYQDELQNDYSVNSDVLFLKKYNYLGDNFEYKNAWVKTNKKTIQPVILQYNNMLNNFPIDCFTNAGNLDDLFVKVYIDGKKTNLFSITKRNSLAFVTLPNDLNAYALVVIKCYSNSPKNNNGTYEIPLNYERNPLNENITTFTLGEITDHVKTITEFHPDFEGEPLGVNNLRDLGELSSYGRLLLQHEGPLNLPLYHLVSKEYNAISGLNLARKQYNTFKRAFLREAESSGFFGSVKDHVDYIIKVINKDKSTNQPFYTSDMIPFSGFTFEEHTVEFTGPDYFALKNTFDLTTPNSKAVLVYLNDVQLLHEIDYTFSNGFVYIDRELQINDVVKIYEYENTNGSFVPPTPVKLGLLPAYQPQIFVDTTYLTPQKVIQGHDGSIVVAYDDYRDDLLLELEKRIFNNIKVKYDPTILDIHDFIPSSDRTTYFTQKDIDAAMLNGFSEWLSFANNYDYTTNNVVDGNGFTYNYTGTNDFNGKILQGSWRSVYKTFYDTDRPHTNPWEMLGFYIKPKWWEEVYGPAPYTRDNLVLWQDLEKGIIREPNKPISVNTKYVRTDLTKHIPVDEYGRLIDPTSSGLANNVLIQNAKNIFTYGDISPAENAWRRSSDYVFSLLKAWMLLNPATVFGLGFDRSRITKNIVGNIVWKDTQKSIKLTDIVVPKIKDNIQYYTSGIINYVAANINSRIDANLTDYQNELSNIKNQLSLRLGGFADKSKIKLVLDSRSPLNKTSVFVPDENYKIFLNKSSVLDLSVISGMIIEQIKNADGESKGFTIRGYDTANPVFYSYKHIEQFNDPGITVGGVSETFVNWGSNQLYTKGTVVFYNSQYYRASITHTSDATFNSENFVKLAKLPEVGGKSAKIRRVFDFNDLTKVYYGTYFKTIQDVVDFMCGYEAYLKQQGFIFDNVSDTGILEDMTLCIKEFLFFNTQNWDNGAVIATSPVANALKYHKDYFGVDNLYDPFYNFSLLSADGESLNPSVLNLYRDNLDFNIKTITESVYLAKLPLIQTEHIILVDNETVFNDIIFDVIPGYRQERIKVVGYKTDFWDGTLNVPGFFYDEAKVIEWSPNTDYNIGDLVKFKQFYYSNTSGHTSGATFDSTKWTLLSEKPQDQLFPNWDYKAKQFGDFYDLDTDNFDTEQQRLAQHLIGYQKREYLNNIITDPTSQYKFYQGFIQDKGTKNALTKLFDPLSTANTDSIEFFEEWALRLGQYGSIDNIEEVEYQLNDKYFKTEPQIVELVDNLSKTRTDLTFEIANYQTYAKPTGYTHTPFNTRTDNDIYTRDAGYVRDKDVEWQVHVYDELVNLDIEKVKIGDNVWVHQEGQVWNVLQNVETDLLVNKLEVNNDILQGVPGYTLTVDTYSHNINKNEVIGIYSSVQSGRGFFKVIDVNGASITVETLTDVDVTAFNDSSIPGISRFVTSRFTTVDDWITSIRDPKSYTNTKVWLDTDSNGDWSVYKNTKNWNLQEEVNSTYETDVEFLSDFAVNDNNTLLAVGAPSYQNPSNVGSVKIWSRPNESFEKTSVYDLTPDTTYHDDDANFGASIAISPDGKYIAVGAPDASNVKTKFVGDLYSADSANIFNNDIVADRGILWKANKNIDDIDYKVGQDGSTINSLNEDFSPVYMIPADNLGTASGLNNQGVVYIFKKGDTQLYELDTIITSPNPTANEEFGYKLHFRNNPTSGLKLFIGAPGNAAGKIYFVNYDDINGWEYTVDRDYKGQYSNTYAYNTNDVVLYDYAFYKALDNLTPGQANPTDATKWELLTGEDTWKEHTGYVPNFAESLNPNSQNIFVNGARIGENFDVNKHGDVLVFTSSNTVNTQERKVGIYAAPYFRWQYVQTLENEFENLFGRNVSINDNGDKVAVSAQYYDGSSTDSGAVYVYKQTGMGITEYAFQQLVENPFKGGHKLFGQNMKFSGNKLAVVGKNIDTIYKTSFDNDETIFDAGNTSFGYVEENTGGIQIFEEIADKFVYAETLKYLRDTSTYDYDYFNFVDNHIYVAFADMIPATENKVDDPIYLDSTYTNQGVIADFRINKSTDSWQVLVNQEEKVDISNINRVFIYDKKTKDIITNLDFIDPRLGKIPGPAEQEIYYKTTYDPAVYTTSDSSNVTVDAGLNWTDTQVGRLWWNVRKAAWYNPYQDSNTYRTSYFNKLVSGFEIEVCEWVGTSLLPSEWNNIANTAQGFANGITGTALYDDNTFSTRPIFDEVKQSFTNYYFYWVKNKLDVPEDGVRKLSADDVAKIITAPQDYGYRFITPLSSNSFALYNIKSYVSGTDSILHISFNKNQENKNNIHYEYQLLSEGYATTPIDSEIERKWIDSLVGYDENVKPVPDKDIPASQKIGVLNFPRQGMFINRLEAVKQFVERVNSVFATIPIVDNYVITQLLDKDEVPLASSGLFDTTADSVSVLRFVEVSKVQTASLTPIIENGRITGANIINPGRGYKNAPLVKITSANGKNAYLKTSIDSVGKVVGVTVVTQGFDYDSNTQLSIRDFSVLVENDDTVGGRWAIYSYQNKEWVRTNNQNYDTTKYWDYADWYATGYNSNTAINHIASYTYDLFALDANINDIVKIENVGSGGWLLLKKIDNQLVEDYTVNYETIGRQNGTISLSTRLYDYSFVTSGYDASIYDSGFYDREPIQELRNILTAIKDDIFVADLAIEYNKLFFASLRYVFSEQSNVDWAFKTSFVKAKHNVSELEQKISYQNDNLESYQDYVNEVKPYKTKVREYVSSYTKVDPTGSLVTDFDLPPSHNSITKEIETSKAVLQNNNIEFLDSKYEQYPFKSWVDNNTYDVVSIKVADGGSGYLSAPQVFISGDNGTTAEAFLSRGSVKEIQITNKGGKYYTAPVVTLEGNLADGGTPARASAILGNANIRSTHMIMKFDRVSGKTYIANIDTSETFTGTGAKNKFKLEWPMNLNVNTFEVTVDNKKLLSSEYLFGNESNNQKTYERKQGYINIIDAPAIDAVISITYKKDVSMLNAADRTTLYYSPTAGMPGNDLSQLMSGVEYEGAIYDSIDFGTETGFDIGGFAGTGFDTFVNTFEDEIFEITTDSTLVETYILSQALETGYEYNVYVKVAGETQEDDWKIYRLDDPAYDGTTVLENIYAQMLPIQGDDSTIEVTIDLTDISTAPGDKVIISKSTSDGSFTPVATTYDTSLSGGDLGYTTATGIEAGDITVDGDGFYTLNTSKGPEEMVPGKVVDTLDIQVYTRASDGVANISVANYRIENDSTDVYALPGLPQSNDAVIVKLDDEILSSDRYSIDWINKTLLFDDSTSSIGNTLSIISYGTNGTGLLDTDTTIFDGSTTGIVTSVSWDNERSALVTVNGKVQTQNNQYTLVESSADEPYPQRVKIQFEPGILVEGDHIQYSIYNSIATTYSQIIIDNTFESNGENFYHKFTGDIPVPFNALPLSHRLLVKSNNKILNPGYSIQFAVTEERTYYLDAWNFADTTAIEQQDVLVFEGMTQLTDDAWTYDPVNCTIDLLRTDVVLPGSQISVYVIKEAEYYMVDTEVQFESVDSTTLDMTEFVQQGDTLTLLASDSTEYSGLVEKIVDNCITFRSIQKDIKDAFQNDNEFIVSVAGEDSTQVKVTGVEYILSNNLTFATPPSSGENIEIYQFSNHDVNDFNRYTFNVTSTTVSPTSDTYIRRNLLSAGVIQLQDPIIGTAYAWVSKNGVLLSPIKDYIVSDDAKAVRLRELPQDNDVIDVLQFGNLPVTPKFGFRIFKDMLGRTHYKRLNQENSYVLQSPLNYYDNTIYLESVEGLYIPNRSKNLPGVLFVEGERVEYFEIKNNTVTQLRRGTLGTGVKNVYEEGTRVYGQSSNETIDYQDTTIVQTIRAVSLDSTQHILNDIVTDINEIDVYVAGKKLVKTQLSVFNPANALDSNEGDTILEPDFSLETRISSDGSTQETVLHLRDDPVEGTEIKIVRQTGKVWNDPGKSLGDSDNAISKFIRRATISLPK